MTGWDRIMALLDELNTQALNVFPASRQPLDAPDTQAVYVVRSPDGAVVHVGRTVRGKQGLRQRLKDHLGASSSFSKGFLKGNGAVLRESYTFQFLEVANDRERLLLEYAATVWHGPVHLPVGRVTPQL